MVPTLIVAIFLNRPHSQSQISSNTQFLRLNEQEAKHQFMLSALTCFPGAV